ncbi:MAG: tRNA (cytidine(34)-2'-O)-methyltransferase [Sulfitobacter sp.]
MTGWSTAAVQKDESAMPDPRMKVVLVTPEIPYNTGAIGRTCVALGLELILIKPYGFSLDERSVRRAGTTYWQHVTLSEYDSWDAFCADRKPGRAQLHFFEETGAHSFYTPAYPDDGYLVFGCESKGLPAQVWDGMEDRVFNLPMLNPVVRSLNLANVATAVMYQAMRPHLGG